MDWHKLLNSNRLGLDAEPQKARALDRSPFQKDADKIVFSSAFRRLQDKTQVHALAENDYIRTRLTHSLEAASVGRSLATLIGQTLVNRHRLTENTADDFGHIVYAACLAHDIGNPPFGHAGEDAIRDWFGQNPLVLSNCSQLEQRDFLRFEGNAQGFRTICRLQHMEDVGGLQLTMATLGAFTKYPQGSCLVGVEQDKTPYNGYKKFGYFTHDKDLFQQVADALALTALGNGCWARHPLAYIVEAADDICYTIVDYEDAHKLGKLTFEHVEEGLMAVGDKIDLRRYQSIYSPDRKIAYLRASAIGNLVEAVAQVFLALEPQILAGRFASTLLEQLPQAKTFQEIKYTSEKYVYDANQIYPSPQTILGALLNQLVGPMPKQYGTLLEITDYLAGMTDRYALTCYHDILKHKKIPLASSAWG